MEKNIVAQIAMLAGQALEWVMSEGEKQSATTAGAAPKLNIPE